MKHRVYCFALTVSSEHSHIVLYSRWWTVTWCA